MQPQPSPAVSPRAKIERNAAVVAARKAGATFGQISIRFGISRPRAAQIVQRAELRAKWGRA